MTGRPSDADLRAMLEARAGRVGVDAERSVLEAVRADVSHGRPAGATREGTSFRVRPVGRVRGRTSVPWPAIAVGLAAVVVVAVLGWRLDVGRDGPGAAAVPSVLGASDTSVPAFPPPDPVPAGSPVAPVGGSLTVDVLRAALEAGSLDGRLIVVQADATLQGGCGDREGRCSWFAIEGLPGVTLTWDGQLAADFVGMPVLRRSVSGPLVVTPADGQLVLLGALPGTGATAVPFADILARRQASLGGGIGLSPFRLDAVDAWLVPAGFGPSCVERDPAEAVSCIGIGRFVTTPPAPDGERPVWVMVAAGAPGLAAFDGSVDGGAAVAGPFLARSAVPECPDDASCLAVAWFVVARYEEADLYRLELP
jgi:hypothetical protein